MAMDSLVLDDSSALSSKLMELTMERQKVIANNIANVDTPGFTKVKFDFEKELANAIKSGDLSNLSELKGELVKDAGGATRLDGNNVVLSNEMNDMMQNGVLYNLLNRAFKLRVNILKSAITGK